MGGISQPQRGKMQVGVRCISRRRGGNNPPIPPIPPPPELVSRSPQAPDRAPGPVPPAIQAPPSAPDAAIVTQRVAFLLAAMEEAAEADPDQVAMVESAAIRMPPAVLTPRMGARAGHASHPACGGPSTSAGQWWGTGRATERGLMALGPKAADRLAKVLGRLGSEHAGERAAAALLVDRVGCCARPGCNGRISLPRWVAATPAPVRSKAASDAVTGMPQPSAAPRGRAAWTLAHLPGASAKERQFLSDLTGRCGPFSQRQLAWLNALAARAVTGRSPPRRAARRLSISGRRR